MARLLREARVVQDINHPNVCPLVASGVLDDGRHFLATELLIGQTLREYLSRRGALSAEEAIEIGVQTLSGLEAAHSVGVVHRDVKPENLFVTWPDNGAPARLRLLDFGLCRREGHALDEKTLTMQGSIVGTPGYLAPEQVRGDRRIEPSVDLFALGLIMFEALAGQRAYGEGDPLQLISKLLSKKVPAVRSIRPELPTMLDRIVAKATELDPRVRYRSAASFQHELLEARTALRREGSRGVAARKKASTQRAPDDEWNVPTLRRADVKPPQRPQQGAARAHPSGQVTVARGTRRWARHG
jgi:serine/threonine-protein kinase